jgi:hypothetical protein
VRTVPERDVLQVRRRERLAALALARRRLLALLFGLGLARGARGRHEPPRVERARVVVQPAVEVVAPRRARDHRPGRDDGAVAERVRDEHEPHQRD